MRITTGPLLEGTPDWIRRRLWLLAILGMLTYGGLFCTVWFTLALIPWNTPGILADAVAWIIGFIFFVIFCRRIFAEFRAGVLTIDWIVVSLSLLFLLAVVLPLSMTRAEPAMGGNAIYAPGEER